MAETATSSFTFDETVPFCDVCGATEFQTVSRDAGVVECRRCGYRFVNPRPSQAQIIAAYSNPNFYDAWIEADAGRMRMWRKRLDLTRKAARGRSVLDVGAGIGTFLALARDQAGWRVAGTEVSAGAVGIARERYGLQLMQGQTEDLSLGRAAYDTITLWHVLEHVPSPSRLLEICHAALAPGGLLVIACPNDDDASQLPARLKAWIMRRLGRPASVPPRYELLRPGSEIHLSHFTRRVLSSLLQRKGFRVVRVTVDDHYPAPNWKTALKVALYRGIVRATGKNLGLAMLVIAQRDAS